MGSSRSSSEISLCYDYAKLHVTHTANNQSYFTPNTDYSQCNSNIYYSDVAEMFIAPYMEKQPHCYNEIDISPYNVMFDAGIYNPNLNQSGIIGNEFGCDAAFSDITHTAQVDAAKNQWTASLDISWNLINCPYNCPLPNYCGHTTPNALYRANFYRIAELKPNVLKCGSTDGS